MNNLTQHDEVLEGTHSKMESKGDRCYCDKCEHRIIEECIDICSCCCGAKA